MQENLKLDYTIKNPEERLARVNRIIETAEFLSPRYLQILADYLISAATKEERKKSKSVTTENRMKTINKRETSFQGLSEKFEKGEDAIYSLIANDKNIIFTPKISITQEEIDSIPALRELRKAIDALEEKAKTATGKTLASIRHQLIQMRQDQYVIKLAYKKPIYCLNTVKNFTHMKFYDDAYVDDNLQIVDNSLISFMRPQHVSALLRNYSRLKEDTYSKFDSDGYYLLYDFQNLIDRTLESRYPLYYSLLIYKIDGKSNLQIQSLLQQEHGVRHSIEYISSLWRKKIPNLIADEAQKEFLVWYCTQKRKGVWKRCSRCGQIKLAHNKFFSRNTSSKDHLYSICKDCRNKKMKPAYKIIKRIKANGEVESYVKESM